MRELRSLLHVARSTVRAGGRRSALVAMLVAVAVAAGVAFNVVGRSAAASPSLERHAAVFPTSNRLGVPSGAALDYFGAADMRIDWWGPPRQMPYLYDLTDDGADWYADMERGVVTARRGAQVRDISDLRRAITQALPRGASTAEFVEGIVPGRAVVVTTADLASPLVSGMFEPLDRQRAARDDEALLSATAMRELGARIGGRISVPGVGSIQVIGRVRDAGDWSRAVMVVDAEPGQLALVGQRHSWLVGGLTAGARQRVVERVHRHITAYASRTALTATDAELVADGEITSGHVNAAAEPPRQRGELWGRSPMPGAGGTALALIVVAVFTVTTFTVDHRRRVRHAGVLVAVGAAPSQVAAVAAFEALLIGTAGAVAGAALGVVGGAVAQPLVERGLQRSITGVTLDPLDILVPALLGPVAAVLAARQSARAAARVTVVDAFRGRPPAPGLGALVPVGAIAALAIVALLRRLIPGAATPALVSYAAVVIIFSVARTLTGLLSRAPGLGGRAPLPLRLALRGLARQQTRAGVVIGVLAVLSAAVVAGVGWGTTTSAGAVASTTGVCVLVALVVIGPTSALGAVESDPDVRLAVAIGASPALRRQLFGWEAALQVFLGSLIGVPAGLLTALLSLRSMGVSGFVVPSPAIGVVTIAVPLAVGAIVALVSRGLPVAAPTRRIT